MNISLHCILIIQEYIIFKNLMSRKKERKKSNNKIKKKFDTTITDSVLKMK